MSDLLSKRKTKTVLHIDGDAFFVAVEISKNPKLRGLPVVTGEERGIVSALSYEAKALGITRGMPIFRLKKEFPQVVILPGDYKSYARYSSKMFDIVRRYADDVEEYSIDECFADLTGLERPLKMSHLEMARRIKDEIRVELDISVSIGVAPTKCLAKVASKWVKPNGLTHITHETIHRFLEEVPIKKIWGIGRQISAFLMKKGVQTAKDFIDKDIYWIREHLSKPYEVIWRELQGIYILEVDPNPKTEYSSVQKTRTFHPATNDLTFLFSQLSKHTEEACLKVRRFDLVPRKVSFFLKTTEFRYKNHEISLPSPTNSPEVIISLIREYLPKIHRADLMYRTAGVTLHGLIPSGVSERDLFGDDVYAKKFEHIHKHIDSLEEKLGKRLLHLGSTHQAIRRETKGTDMDDEERHLVFL